MGAEAAAAAGSGAMAMANIQFAMSALSIGMSYVAQEQQAKAIYEHQKEQAKATQTAAADAARHQYMGLLERGSQAQEAAAQDVQKALGQTIEASASARVAAAAGGVTGGVVDETVSQWGQEFTEWAANRMKNLSWEEAQIEASMRGVQAQQEGRMQQAVGDPVMMPSPAVALSQIGAAGFDAAKFWGYA